IHQLVLIPNSRPPACRRRRYWSEPNDRQRVVQLALPIHDFGAGALLPVGQLLGRWEVPTPPPRCSISASCAGNAERSAHPLGEERAFESHAGGHMGGLDASFEHAAGLDMAQTPSRPGIFDVTPSRACSRGTVKGSAINAYTIMTTTPLPKVCSNS